MRVSPASDEAPDCEFSEFFAAVEERLRGALSVAFGSELGREATQVALTYGWERWARVAVMDNPVGYLFTVGRNFGRREVSRRDPAVAEAVGDAERSVEPALEPALAALSERQRMVLGLVYGYGWSLTETAGLLGISKSTAQNHAERGLARLRRALGVQP